MGRTSRLILGLTALVALSGCDSGEPAPKTKEDLQNQLSKTVDYDSLPADQKAKLPNRGDGTPTGPPEQFKNDRTGRQ